MSLISLIAILAILAIFPEISSGFRLGSASLQNRVRFDKREIAAPLSAKSKWSKEELAGKDYFEDEDLPESNQVEDLTSGKKKKKKVKLEPEVVFYEGPPSRTEIIIPAISILTVIGIVPFIAALTRQLWVRYKFTSRRISIKSGFGGKTQTEIIYPDVQQIRFAYRAFGAAGDMVLFLKDGAKVELRHVPNFKEIYEFVLSKCDDECKSTSMKVN
jgi:hypothetical protein